MTVNERTVPSTREEAFRRLTEVEARFDLLSVMVDGWAIWPLLRTNALMQATAYSILQPVVMSRTTRVLRVLSDLYPLCRIQAARHLIKTYTSGLIEQHGERYADVWFDDVMMAAGSTFKIECANNPNFADRSRRPQVPRTISSSSLDLASAILSRLPATPEVSQAAHRISRALNEGLGISIGEKAIAQTFKRFSTAKRVYATLLRRVRPAFVLVVDPSEFALVAAARETGSIVLELQHGIVDRSHPLYSWTPYARSHRVMMPLPDRLLLYGEHWRREIDQGFWGDDARPVGSTRIDRWRGEPVHRDDEVCTILFTTQGLDIPGITAFLQSFFRGLNGRTRVRLVIKLHPIYDTDPGPYREALAAFRDQVQIIAGHEGASTLEWLKRAHLHISVASGSHYEAIGLGVPTVILPFDPYEVVLPLHRAGHALFAPTADDLVRIVGEFRDLIVPQHVSDYYFAVGARTNILRELELS